MADGEARDSCRFEGDGSYENCSCLTDGKSGHKYVLRVVEEDQQTAMESDAEAIYDFLLSSCSSDALEKIASSVKMEVSVLGPPALECCGCRKPLVSYLTTFVTLYTCSSVQQVEKVILRCKECNLILNPTQFGNKHVQG